MRDPVRCPAAGDLVTTFPFPLPPTHFPGFLGLLLPHPTATLPDVATASGLSLELTCPRPLLLLLTPKPYSSPGRPPARPSIPGPGRGEKGGRRRRGDGRFPVGRKAAAERPAPAIGVAEGRGPPRPGLRWGCPVDHF